MDGEGLANIAPEAGATLTLTAHLTTVIISIANSGAMHITACLLQHALGQSTKALLQANRMAC